MPATGECASSPIGSARSPGCVSSSSAVGMNCRAMGSSGSLGVDQRGDVGRHRDRIARRDLLERGEIGSARKAVGDQLVRLAQRACQIDPAHLSPAGGVHTT